MGSWPVKNLAHIASKLQLQLQFAVSTKFKNSKQFKKAHTVSKRFLS